MSPAAFRTCPVCHRLTLNIRCDHPNCPTNRAPETPAYDPDRRGGGGTQPLPNTPPDQAARTAPVSTPASPAPETPAGGLTDGCATEHSPGANPRCDYAPAATPISGLIGRLNQIQADYEAAEAADGDSPADVVALIRKYESRVGNESANYVRACDVVVDLRALAAAVVQARAEALGNPYDEDGYCEGCGNGSWKAHAPDCGWADLRDAREQARAEDRARIEVEAKRRGRYEALRAAADYLPENGPTTPTGIHRWLAEYAERERAALTATEDGDPT